MKKNTTLIFIFLIIFLISLIILNALKNIGMDIKAKKEEEIIKEEKKIIEYKANQTIRVKLCDTNEIVAMDVNDYLRGVLPAEMPPYYEMDALKAQAIVARTYLYRKMSTNSESQDFDICDNPSHCQAFYNKEKILEIWTKKGYDSKLKNVYWDRVNDAVVSTENEVILYNGDYIRAYFHASSPIKTESSNEIWGREEIPYLKSVENNEEEDYQNRYSSLEISYEDFLNKLKGCDEKFSDINKIDFKDICISDYTISGRVKILRVCNIDILGEKLRTILGLKSTMFSIKEVENGIRFDVIGNGHGIGMSQVGANFYAKNKMNYIDIIKHYYTGVEIKKIDIS